VLSPIRSDRGRERQPPASVARLEPRPPEETGRAIKQQDDPIMTAKQFLAAIKRLGPSTPGYVRQDVSRKEAAGLLDRIERGMKRR
jgi:hypothetical protein